MHDDAEFMPLKIHAVIAQSKAMQGSPRTFELSESLEIGGHNFLGHSAKLTKNVQLEFLRHSRQFTRTRGIEDDLEWAHGF